MNTESHAISASYTGVAQAFHWATAITVLAAFILGPGGSEQHVYAASRDFDRQLHETLGLCVFALSVLRLVWRSFDTRPETPQLAPLMDMASRAVHVTLYLLLFAVPLTAILGAWFEGHPLTLIAGLQVHAPFAVAHETGALIANIHPWLADAILWLAGLHALAAIYHHIFLRDNVLSAMLPRWVAGAIAMRGYQGKKGR